MKSISLKLPAGLHAKLDRASIHRKQSKSDIVRAALELYLNSSYSPNGKQTISALELAGDLVGCSDGPHDLSTNPDYLKGYGQ
jgi:metal-responsive CopG/Arc/MetJ family transcriptional regulator